MSRRNEKYGELHEVARRAADRLQGCAQVAEHLVSLRGKIVLADQITIAIESGLAGDEDDAAGADLDDLRIARRRAELGRIEAPNRL